MKKLYSTYLLSVPALMILSFVGEHFIRSALNFRNFHYLLQIFLAVLFMVEWKKGQEGFRQEPPPLIGQVFWIGTFILFILNNVFKYLALEVNGMDFSIFDYMLFTKNGYSPVYSVYHMGIHPSYILFILKPLHMLLQSPFLLIIAGPVILWLSGLVLHRLVREYEIKGYLSFIIISVYFTASFFVTVLNGNFRIEVFYPLFLFLLLLYWKKKEYNRMLISALLFLSVKEDAAIYLIGFSVVDFFYNKDKKYPIVMILLSTVVLTTNMLIVQPYFLSMTGKTLPGYIGFWGNYGNSYTEIVFGVLKNPLQAMGDVFKSGIWSLVIPFFFLPFLSIKTFAAIAPFLLLYSISQYPAMNQFQTYYPLLIFSFLIFGLLEVYNKIGLWRNRRVLSTLMMITIIILPVIGPSWFTVPLPKMKEYLFLKANIKKLNPSSGDCVHPGLFPYFPYNADYIEMTKSNLSDCRRIITGFGFDEFPFKQNETQLIINNNALVSELNSGTIHLYILSPH